jgi:carbon storage regulator
MLVLSRKPLQSIMIGPDIRITIVKVERNQVRIGIEAPRDVTILRDELVETGEPDAHTGSGTCAKVPVMTV